MGKRIPILALSLVAFFCLIASATTSGLPKRLEPPSAMVRIPGHVLPALAKAKQVTPTKNESNQPMALTIVLKRDDQAGFEKYLHEVYDPHSRNFHRYLTQQEIVDRFGPSPAEYDSVIAFLHRQGFEDRKPSANRLTIRVIGSRREVEDAFDLQIADYRIQNRSFFANDRDPAVPSAISGDIGAIVGLSDFAQPRNTASGVAPAFSAVVQALNDAGVNAAKNLNDASSASGSPSPQSNSIIRIRSAVTDPSPTWINIDGSGQAVGLVEFDNFNPIDIANYLALTGQSSSLAGQVTEKNVDGGTSIGASEPEVLIDIIGILGIAPGAKVTVYDAPFTDSVSSFQDVFQQMLADGVSIISNSWYYCESESDSADAGSIDTIVQNAAMAGVSVFNATGDSGAACAGSNGVALPASSPNATAVGGSSATALPGFVYGSEMWWNGTAAVPPSGQGGFGTSQFFMRPSYQNLLDSSANRSVPDVVVNADPAKGIIICQADAGGCPTGLTYGGTSLSAPEWAAFTALLNQGQGQNLGFLNPLIYPFANTNSFHSPSSMGSDFAHVGLGSPNVDLLHLALSSGTIGAVSSTFSQVQISDTANLANPISTDPSTTYVVVTLRDANGNTVSGKNVTLAAEMGSSAQISPASAVTTISNGAAVFTVTDAVHEVVTFSATDASDDIQIAQTATNNFAIPPAVSETLNASPMQVTADGMTQASINVTLTDWLGHPSPGKVVQLNQTGGNSVIGSPNPPVTDSTGTIRFTAVDSNDETVTYSAVDVTDGNRPFPETGTITFNNAPEAGCSNTFPPAPGYVAQPYATGFLAENFSVGNVFVSGCPGAFGMAFDASGDLYVVDQPTGSIYKIPPGGGVADASHRIGTQPSPVLDEIRIDSSGNLYGGLNATDGTFTNGAVVQLDPTTGQTIRTVASGLTCPGLLSIDPISGDIFTDDNCSGGGLNSNVLTRVSNPDTTPTVSTYINLPSSPDGTIAFAPNGTMYIDSASQVAQVSGTNGPATPTMTTLSNQPWFGLALLAQGPTNGAAQFLISSFNQVGATPGGIGTFDLTKAAVPQSSTLVTTGSQPVEMIIGPDGCLYAARGVAVFRVTDTTGACTYAAANPPPSLYLSPITSNPAQGSSQSFTVATDYASVPDGTSVLLNVTGANARALQATTASGIASFKYTGAHQGVDTVTASATINNAAVTSNNAVITWRSGTDVTFLTLNASPSTGTIGQAATLTANLTDVSTNPPTPLSGQSVNFSLGGVMCSNSTDSKGNASCQAVPGGTGTMTLSGSFAGTSQYNASSDARGFTVLMPTPTPSPTPSPTPTPTPKATPTPTPSQKVGPLLLLPPELDFGHCQVRQHGATNKALLLNPFWNNGTALIRSITIQGSSDFTIDSHQTTCGSMLPRGRTCLIAIQFNPGASGKREGKLIVQDNAFNSPQQVILDGDGDDARR